jgi:hypothetical protein
MVSSHSSRPSAREHANTGSAFRFRLIIPHYCNGSAHFLTGDSRDGFTIRCRANQVGLTCGSYERNRRHRKNKAQAWSFSVSEVTKI